MPHRKRIQARNAKYHVGVDYGKGFDTTVVSRRLKDGTFEIVKVDQRRIEPDQPAGRQEP